MIRIHNADNFDYSGYRATDKQFKKLNFKVVVYELKHDYTKKLLYINYKHKLFVLIEEELNIKRNGRIINEVKVDRFYDYLSSSTKGINVNNIMYEIMVEVYYDVLRDNQLQLNVNIINDCLNVIDNAEFITNAEKELLASRVNYCLRKYNETDYN